MCRYWYVFGIYMLYAVLACIIISIAAYFIMYLVGKMAGKNKYDIIQYKEQAKTLYDTNKINADNSTYTDDDVDKWLRKRASKSS